MLLPLKCSLGGLLRNFTNTFQHLPFPTILLKKHHNLCETSPHKQLVLSILEP